MRRKLDTAQRNMGEVFATFQRFDRSRNGRLEYRDVKEALRAMGFDPNAKEAKSIVARYDKDRGDVGEIWGEIGEFEGRCTGDIGL